MQELKELFSFSELPRLNEVLEIVSANTRGFVYLIGGGVTRQIVSKRYDRPLHYRDIDFVAEYVRPELILPPGWIDNKNSYGSHKITNGGMEIDLWDVTQQHSIVSRNLKFSIDKVFEFSPLTIQSIAYDMKLGEVIGLTGLTAIAEQTVAVNCPMQAAYYCGLKNLTINDFISQKAKALGFKPILVE